MKCNDTGINAKAWLSGRSQSDRYVSLPVFDKYNSIRIENGFQNNIDCEDSLIYEKQVSETPLWSSLYTTITSPRHPPYAQGPRPTSSSDMQS
jgi:hypothetical protein